MNALWTPEMLALEKQTIHTAQGRQRTILKSGCTLWHVTQILGQQTVLALDELGFVRTDALGQTHGFKVRDLGVSPGADRVLVHLDVTDHQLFSPQAPKGRQGKPLAYVSLIGERVLEQLRIRASEALGGPVEVYPDNHYWVRYVYDLSRLLRGEADVAQGELADHLADVPGPFAFPWGLARDGQVVWHDLREGYHFLITGRSGSGKTTWLHTVITTLAQSTPTGELQMVFLDPQRLNYSPFQCLSAYAFRDRQGALGVVARPEDIVSALVRVNEEHLRRTDLIAETAWGDIEDYNAHVPAEQRLPYIAIFSDELALLRALIAEQLDARAGKAFEAALAGLLMGSRKVGIRVFLCLQYLKGEFLDPATAAQAGLIVAFRNSPQGSRNTLGDGEATLLRAAGRFIVEGLATGRQIFQGLYVDRETVMRLLSDGRRQSFPVNGVVLEMLHFASEHAGGQLNRDELHQAFCDLMSKRQVNHFLDALERVGLAHPPDRSQVPPQPRRLSVDTLEAALEVLQYHPEIAFHTDPARQDGALLFGPGAPV